jgi:magnesium-transporting ATPase (P-type)
LRPGVPDKVRWLKNMGIRPLMLTGDRPEAAMAVGQQAGIGLDSQYCLTGKDIARMALQEVARQAAHVSIFARLLPSQKGILVRLLQQRGHSVAMVGDGANDAVALRAADVGISFGESSSPLAKRVSRILIHDLADLLTMIAGAKRVERWLKYLMLFRIAALISMLVGLYAWTLG